jgi:hypothetical protein
MSRPLATGVTGCLVHSPQVLPDVDGDLIALVITYVQMYFVKRLVDFSTTYGYLFILLILWKEVCGRVTITAALCSGDPHVQISVWRPAVLTEDLCGFLNFSKEMWE